MQYSAAVVLVILFIIPIVCYDKALDDDNYSWFFTVISLYVILMIVQAFICWKQVEKLSSSRTLHQAIKLFDSEVTTKSAENY